MGLLLTLLAQITQYRNSGRLGKVDQRNITKIVVVLMAAALPNHNISMASYYY